MPAVFAGVVMVVGRAGMGVRMRMLMIVRMAMGRTAVRVFVAMCVAMRVRAFHNSSRYDR